MSCPLCAQPDPVELILLRNMPVLCNQLWPDSETAKAAPSGDIDLVQCTSCALIWNRAFDPALMDYAPGYENALHFSPKFQAFAEDLARGLIDRLNLQGAHILEIGCGDGQMLDLMVKHGAKSATGYDPSMAGTATPFTAREGVTIVPEYFHPEQPCGDFDAVICRHVLEHLDEPLPFLQDIRGAIGNRRVPVYFEVPNADWMLAEVSVWDVIYEHVTYWTAPAIEALCRRAGFDPISISSGYGGQFLMVEAVPGDRNPDWVSPEVDAAQVAGRAFAQSVNGTVAEWRHRLLACRGVVAIWGAGSKGISFVNMLAEDGAPIAALVDVNPRKHGLYAPVIGLPVVSPDELVKIKPDLVLIANAIYKAEIERRVQETGMRPSFEAIAS